MCVKSPSFIPARGGNTHSRLIGPVISAIEAENRHQPWVFSSRSAYGKAFNKNE